MSTARNLKRKPTIKQCYHCGRNYATWTPTIRLGYCARCNETAQAAALDLFKPVELRRKP